MTKREEDKIRIQSPVMRLGGLKNPLRKLVERIPENSSMVEIGSYLGESTLIFLDSGRLFMVYAVDPWVNGYDPEVKDIASFRFDMDLVEARFDEVVAPYRNHIFKLKMTSEQASSNFPDQSLDFVYIDGNHTYESVKQDIVIWRKKIRLGGIIAGHDYGWPGLTQAIIEELGEIPIGDRFSDNSWMKFL